MTIQMLAVLLSFSIFLFVVELVRRHKLTFKYAFVWLLVSSLGVVCAVFKGLVFRISAVLGFEVPSNFIFFTLFCVFIFVSLLLTVFLCQQNSRNDRMAQKIALLEAELKSHKHS